ncbi:hypothetical protein EUA66_00760 [TM7 phylum sp. oral taxon 349]|nr:hypothetical protein EUA66_00760 [TM7 phylum sp. oral taxon 349]
MPPNNQANPLQQPAPPGPVADSLYNSQQTPLSTNPIASQQNPLLQQPLDDKNKKPAVKQSSTQNSLLLSELRDSMVIMNDGTFRAVVACKSINFDLMSSRERDGVELSYQDFLNALYFPIQVFIRSQQVDIGPYIDKLTLLRRDEDNMLLGVLMEDYINFIDMLSQEANIMDKSFFVVIPYYPTGDISEILDQSKGFFSSIFGKKKDPVTKIDKETYKKAKEEIKNRVDSVVSGLIRVGVQTSRLNTKQLGELYYNIYNPDTAVREPLGDFNNVASLYVRKGDKSESVQGVQF